MASAVDAFPWTELPKALSCEGELADAVAAAHEAFELERLAPMLRDVFGASLDGMGTVSRRTARTLTGAPLAVRVTSSALDLVLRAESELVAFVLARLLDKPFRLSDPEAVPSPQLVGAWHALVLELGRRLCRTEPPSVAPVLPSEELGPASVFDSWVAVDGRSFRLELAVLGSGARPRPPRPTVPITLRLVLGRALLSRAELQSLRPGDALLPGPGWLDPAQPESSLVAIAPGDERGFRLSVSDVVRYEGPGELPHDHDTPEIPVEDATKESLIADVPVVIRVEVGSITLTAGEWMQLRPGDVVSCGIPPRGPVVLRAGGRELAQGELVTVDGELGVRISRVGPDGDPETLPQSPETEG